MGEILPFITVYYFVNFSYRYEMKDILRDPLYTKVIRNENICNNMKKTYKKLNLKNRTKIICMWELTT